MSRFHLKNAALAAAIISLVSACGGGGGGGATPTASSSPPATSTTSGTDTTGQVINSYITGATVTLDVNDDGICDISEPQTTTDASGNYKFSGKGTHLVCATGGVNTVTGLQFVGMLKAPAGATVVTPLTSLIVAQVQKTAVPVSGKAAPLDPTAVAAAQTSIMTQLSLPASAPVLTTDPVALMTKAGATAADAKLEQTNAAVQVLLQQVTQSIIASANLPAAASTTATNEAFNGAVTGLQTALTATGTAPIDLTVATTASTGQLVNAMAIKATATVKSSTVLAAVSASFAALSPTSIAASIAASPLPDLVNSVASASTASLTTKGGAETIAASSTQVATVMQQLSPLMTVSADAGAVSVAELTNVLQTLLPNTGIAATQSNADTAIASAIAAINAALPAGSTPLPVPVVPVQPPVVIPKK